METIALIIALLLAATLLITGVAVICVAANIIRRWKEEDKK